MYNLSRYFDKILGDGTPHNTSRGLQYSYCCPICNDYKERLFINVDRQKYYCHNCGSGGSVISLIALYNHIPWGQALKLFRDYEGYSIILPQEIEDEIYDKLGVNDHEVHKYIYPLPKEFKFIDEGNSSSAKKARQYIKNRGISMKDAIKYCIGYCEEGYYADRLILPNFEGGDVVYWQGRSFLPTPTHPVLKKQFRKVLNPTLTKEQVNSGLVAIDKSEVIGNIDLALDRHMVVLCEGFFDGITIGDMGCCTHGKVLSDSQFVKLIKHKKEIDVIAVMYDGDAFKDTLITAQRLYTHFDDVLVCKLPPDKDPNELGKKGCLEVIEKAIKYSPSTHILARLQGWS